MLTITFIGQVAEVTTEDKLQTGNIITSVKDNETIEFKFTNYISNTTLESNKYYLVIGHLYLYENEYCVQIKKSVELAQKELCVVNSTLLAKIHGGKNEPTKYLDIKDKKVLQLNMVNRTPIKDHSNWLNVLVYNEKLHQYLEKLQNNNSFYVEGNIMFNSYKNKDGDEVKTMSLMLNSFEFVSGGSNTKDTNSSDSKNVEYTVKKDKNVPF